MNPSSESERLEKLVLDAVLDPSVSAETLQAELRASGVDIDGLLRRTHATIGDALRGKLQELAAAERAARRQDLERAQAAIAGWSLDQLRDWLRDAAHGAFGAAAQSLAQPCFRNRVGDTMTEDELRTLAAEIKAAGGEKL